MATIKAAVLTAFGGSEGFEIQEVPKPTPKANQVLVRVCATSISPVDYQIRRGDYKDYMQLPAIIGLDVSGVVEAVGDTVTAFKPGDDLVKKLGADRVIDYKTEDYVDVIQRETGNQGVDVVFDTIGGKTIQQSFDTLRPFGRLVSIVDIAAPQSLLAAWDRNLSAHFVFNPVNAAKLEALKQLIEREQLKPVIDSIMPWQQVSQAIKKLEQGGTKGEIVLDFSGNG